jgi:hypothetical protein
LVFLLLFGCLAPVKLRGQSVINGTNCFQLFQPIFPTDKRMGTAVCVSAAGLMLSPSTRPTRTMFWLGTATGRVWHSTIGGANWLPMSDNEASLSIGTLALDGCNSDGCVISSRVTFTSVPSKSAKSPISATFSRLALYAHGGGCPS